MPILEDSYLLIQQQQKHHHHHPAKYHPTQQQYHHQCIPINNNDNSDRNAFNKLQIAMAAQQSRLDQLKLLKNQMNSLHAANNYASKYFYYFILSARLSIPV